MRIKLSLALLLLSSCLKMSEEEQRQNLMSQPSLEESVQKNLAAPFFTEGSWPKKNWWEDFDCPTLNAYIAQGLACNPTIQSVQQKIEQAKEEAARAKSKLYPLLYFDADGNFDFVSKQGIEKAYNKEFPTFAKIVDLTLSFTYEFDFWNKYRNLYRSALSLEEAEKAELAQVELITATAIAKSYFALRTNLAKQRIYIELYDVRRKLYLLRQLLVREALDDLRILLLSQEKVEEAQKNVHSIEEEVVTTSHLLNILMGLGPDEPLYVDSYLPKLPPALTIPDTVSIDLLSRRPDLIAQIFKLKSLSAQAGAAKAHFFPNINLANIFGLSSTILHLLFNGSSFENLFTPSLALPLYTAGEIQANLDSKRAEFQAAVFAYNEMILQSTEEVADALVFARTIFANKLEQEKIVSQASQRLFLSELRLRNALDNALETLEQKQELLQKELEDLNLAYGRYTAAILLIKSLGGGYYSQ